MHKKELQEILNRYRSGTATDDDKAFLESWYLQYQDTPPADYSVAEQINDADAIWVNMQREQEAPVRELYWSRIATAAIILVVMSLCLYFYTSRSDHQNKVVVSQKQQFLAPGKNTGILTLSNGRKINLSEAKNGELARQSGIVVSKSASGQLIYSVSAVSRFSRLPEYNTIETPRGGQYQIRLPDGTAVWLNSASSLKFPATFRNQRKREVELNGEAYFEVAKDRSKPFRVVSAHQTVEVLGTHFSISAYKDDNQTTTTLVEGSVKVATLKHRNIIKPGEQTIFTQGSLRVQPADIDEALAWKNGYFRFSDEKITDVVRKLSRWYNVDFEFEGQPTSEGFNGVISRSKNLPQVLKMLEKTKVIHFKVSGRRIMVK